MRVFVGMMVLVSVLLCGCGSQPLGLGGLNALDMQKKPSPDFALTNYDGTQVRLSGLRGKVVALTFLYTNCQDVCPLAAATFGQAYDRLGDSRSKAAFVAVTVDPERDTVDQIRQYVEIRRLDGKMLFLTGGRPELEQVWAEYYVGVARQPTQVAQGDGTPSYDVVHDTLVYLIDPLGRERILIKDFNFTADQLANEMRSLMSEAS